MLNTHTHHQTSPRKARGSARIRAAHDDLPLPEPAAIDAALMRQMDALINLPRVMAFTSLSRSEIYRRMDAGTFPQPVILSECRRAWRISQIEAWMRTLQTN